jgi:type I restriction enzyme S subunit
VSDVPLGWTVAPLGHVIDGIEAGKNIRCIERPPEGEERGIVKLSAVSWGRFNEAESKTIPPGAEVDERARIGSGDLLISRANTIELVGACVRVGAITRTLYLSDKVLRLRAATGIVPWLHYYLSSPSARKAIADASSGNQLSMRNISQGALKALIVPIAPPAEQCRISKKLDAVLAKSNACRASLQRIPQILKKFRETVLEAAVSGRLTGQWRETRGAGSWEVLPLAVVCRSITDGDHQAPPQANHGIPFVTISAINDGRLQLEKATRHVPNAYFESLKPERRPEVGDVLFSVTGSIAIPAIVDTPKPFTFQRHIAILKPDTSRVASKFLLYTLGARSLAIQARSVATGTAQLTIPLSALRQLNVSIPDLNEQMQVVRRVDELLSLGDRLERRYETAAGMVEKLTPSVLAKAFRGELVPQDPSDEPAGEMLERMKGSSLNVRISAHP